MRNLCFAPVLAVALIGAAPALAQQETTPSTASGEENGATPAKPAKPAKPRKICRQDEATYSRMPTKVCKTQEEWDALDGRNRGTRNIPDRATN